MTDPNATPFPTGGEPRAHVEARRRTETSPIPPGQSSPTKDHVAAGPTNLLNLAFEHRRGKVVGIQAYARSYRVILEGVSPIIEATPVSPSSLTLPGFKLTPTYSPGDSVLCVWHHSWACAYIIGAIPDFQEDPAKSQPDVIVPGSNVGSTVDAYSSAILDYTSEGPSGLNESGVADWSADRPFDALGAGESNWTGETGIGFHFDSVMFFARISEETGVFGFYQDDLLRVSGHNLQLRTAGSEREDLDDESEFSSVEGFTPYPWEALGVRDFNNDADRDYTAQESQIDQPYYFSIEPSQDDQQGYYRLTTFRGYLGQGRRTVLTALPQLDTGGSDDDEDDDTTPPVGRLSSMDILPGLFEEQLDLTGRYVARTAKSYAIVKRPQIPAAKRVKRPEDPRGDALNPPDGTDYDQYNPAGQTGTNTDTGDPLDKHKVKEAVQLPDSSYGSGPSSDDTSVSSAGDDLALDYPQLIRAAGFMDQLAYSCNWEGTHPFVYHSRDWYIPEEEDLDYQSGNPAPQYETLGQYQFLDPPEPFSIEIDGRYGQAMYFPNESYLAFLDDGGVVLGDGFGSEIRMTGGSIFQTCPGDLHGMPGRDFLVYAGLDAAVRANNSVDVTAANGSVRLKAEKDLMALGGNGGCGGVLIECRGKSAFYNFLDDETGGPSVPSFEDVADSDDNFEPGNDPNIPPESTAHFRKGDDASFSGIVFKARDSQIANLSDSFVTSANTVNFTNAYQRHIALLAADQIHAPLAEEIDPRFVVDMTERGKVVFHARAFERHLGGEDRREDHQGTGPGSGDNSGESSSSGSLNTPFYQGSATDFVSDEFGVFAVYEYGPYQANMSGSLRVVGPSLFGDDLTIYGFGKSSESFLAGDTDAENQYDDLLEAVGRLDTYEQANRYDGWKDYALVASGSVLTATFSLRTPTEYRTDMNFVLFESRWQQSARLNGAMLPVWCEPPVFVGEIGYGDGAASSHSGSGEYFSWTMPHPGYEEWAVESNLFEQDLTFYNPDTNVWTKRVTTDGDDFTVNDDYADPKYRTPNSKVLQSNYTVSVDYDSQF